MKFKLFLALFVIFSLIISGCDDNHSWNGGDRKVKQVKINATVGTVGTEVPVDTYFETDHEAGMPEDLELAIRLDPELQYLSATSKLYVGGDGHHRAPDKMIYCEDGSTYLWYEIDREDDLRYYTGEEKFDMRIKIVFASPSDMSKVEAKAGKRIDIDCNEEFLYQEDDAVKIEE